jgi:glycosyltransferase involved in cell wall biosynthesis
MRIALVTETLDIGGAERMAVALANELDTAGHQVWMLCLKHAGPLAAGLAAGVTLVEFGKQGGNSVRLWWQLASVLRRAGVDVVHAQDFGSFLDAWLGARLAGVARMLVTAHGRYMAGHPGVLAGLKRRCRHWLERYAFRTGARLVCVSAALRLELAQEIGMPAAQMRVVHNGIQAGAERAESVEPDAARPGAGGPANSGLRLICVGRLAAVKNLALLLRALALLRVGCPGATLEIVGDGPERSSLEALAVELRIQAAVQFSGYRSDIAERMADADVFVLSSDSEGIPMAILEAMAAALPVVATRVGGVPDTVQDGVTGLLVDKGDAAALAAALAQLDARPALRHALGAAGQRTVRERFSANAMRDGYLELYQAQT